jgi:hypothetical protein
MNGPQVTKKFQNMRGIERARQNEGWMAKILKQILPWLFLIVITIFAGKLAK